MNSPSARRETWTAFYHRGQSALEFAFAAPALVLLLMVVLDFGRFFAISVAVNSAARAGAQYGSQTVATAADTSGMRSAATTQWNNSGLALTVSPSQCTCVSGSSVPACASSYCNDDAQATFVEVDTQLSYSALATYLQIPNSVMTFIGIPSNGTLSGKAVMQVQQ